MKPEQVIGALLFAGAFQFMLCMFIAESWHSGYNAMTDFISELGIGNNPEIFNISAALLGISLLVSSYFLSQVKRPLLAALVLLTGIGAIGVGLFPMDVPGPYHVFFSFLAFLFGGLTAIYSYKRGEALIGIVSMLLGVISLAALTLFASGNYLPIGVGFTERLITWPVIIWGTVFGFNLMSKSRNGKK